MTNAHYRRNFFARVRVTGNRLFGEEEIKEGVTAFSYLFTENGDWRPNINGLSFESLTQEDVRSLEHPLFEEEVFSALSALNGDKALGPNGFTMAFWHLCWDFIKSEVLSFFKEFFVLGQFECYLFGLNPKEGWCR